MKGKQKIMKYQVIRQEQINEYGAISKSVLETHNDLQSAKESLNDYIENNEFRHNVIFKIETIKD